MSMSDLERETICPLEVSDCEWLLELAQLRQQNEELKRLVTTDTLTGLYNYRYFRDILSREIESSQRSVRSTCLLMIDIDHFKLVNDKWGHEAGNQALKMAAQVFKQAIRISDVLCRYGGEEFAVILPHTRLPTAVKVAERIRLALEKSPVVYDGQSFCITASFGAGVYAENNSDTLGMFVGEVDRFLYKAKQQGRNRVCHADYSSLKADTAVSAEEKSALFNVGPEKQIE